MSSKQFPLQDSILACNIITTTTEHWIDLVCLLNYYAFVNLNMLWEIANDMVTSVAFSRISTTSHTNTMNHSYDKEAYANLMAAFRRYGLQICQWDRPGIDFDAWAWLILDKPVSALRTASHGEIVNGVARIFGNITRAWDLDDGELQNNRARDGKFWEDLLRYSALRVCDTSDEEFQHSTRAHCKAFQSLVEMFEHSYDSIQMTITTNPPVEDADLCDFENTLDGWMQVRNTTDSYHDDDNEGEYH